jgi:aryl-alcohol dehydrogenase-like predicted oxidoreductase
MARALDIGVTAWSQLGNGLLTGKYNKNRDQLPQQRQQQDRSLSSSTVAEGKSRLNMFRSMSPDLVNALLNETNLLIAEIVSKISKEIGRSPAQVALNWIRRQMLPRQGKIIPIIGSRRESQIKDNLACREYELSNELIQRSNEISKIELGFPHDFLNTEMIKEIIYGGTYSSIHDHRK